MNTLGRILVVTDDARELATLRRSFADADTGWEAQFDASESEALSSLDQQPVDVVFAELSSGALATSQFLHEIWKKCPQTVRFLLGTGMQPDVMIECTLGAHQFLEKPLEAQALKLLLTRTQTINRLIQNPNVKTLVSRMRTLPSRPSVSMEVMRELRSSSASAQAVGEMISKDLSISSKLIQVVNSAYYGWARQVSEPGDAVLLLGMEATASLVLSIESFARFDKIKPLYFSIDEVWRHSQRVAHNSKTIAETISGDPAVVKDAFTAGLLHDIGKLALALNFEEQYRTAIGLAERNNLSTCQAEMEVFGACHPEAGAYLLSIWGLPITIIEAVASHHQPARRLAAPFSAATAVHLAERFEHEEELKRRGVSDVQVDFDYAPELNLQPQMEIVRRVTQGASLPKVEARPAVHPRTIVPVVPMQTPGLLEVPLASRKTGRIFAFAAMLVTASAIAAFFTSMHWNSDEILAKRNPGAGPTLPVRVSAPRAPAAPSAPSAPAAEQPAPAPSFPTLKLQAVIYREIDAQARINGRSVRVGDEIEGVRITAIVPGSVTIERSGVQRKLELR